jgi:hypothetical protein
MESRWLSPGVQRRATVLRRWMIVVALLCAVELVWTIVGLAVWSGPNDLIAYITPLGWLYLLSPILVGFSVAYCGVEGASGNEPLLAQSQGWSCMCFFWTLFLIVVIFLTKGPTPYLDLGIQLAFQVVTAVVFAGAFISATRLQNSLKPMALVTTSPGVRMRFENPQAEWRYKHSLPLVRPVDTSVPREVPQAVPLATAV